MVDVIAVEIDVFVGHAAQPGESEGIDGVDQDNGNVVVPIVVEA